MISSLHYDGLLLYTLYVLSWEVVRRTIKANHYETAYWGERRGRTRVEQEMKKISDIQLNKEDGFYVQPVGYIESCFRQCVGTPRQGALVPSSRARLILTSNISPEALDGLEEFSHIWLSFKFHLNTNTLKESKAFAGITGDNKKYTFTAKITPPMLKEKKGIFATRSPHRPNPIGVTLAKIESVNKLTHSVLLSACDLVDGTPVLDIKPYVPSYDTVSSCNIPTWIEETIDTRNIVKISHSVYEDVQRIQKKLKQFKNDPNGFIQAVTETLEADVRSKFQTKRRMEDSLKGIVVEIPFDETIVQFYWREERLLEVVEIILAKDAHLEEKEKLGIENVLKQNEENEVSLIR